MTRMTTLAFLLVSACILNASAHNHGFETLDDNSDSFVRVLAASVPFQRAGPQPAFSRVQGQFAHNQFPQQFQQQQQQQRFVPQQPRQQFVQPQQQRFAQPQQQQQQQFVQSQAQQQVVQQAVAQFQQQQQQLPAQQQSAPLPLIQSQIANAAQIRTDVNNGIQQQQPTFAQSIADLPPVPKFCMFKGTIKCDPKFPYRTFDGSCNNLKNLWWGKTNTPYQRLMSPAYADGVSLPRVARDGTDLPNPVDISCNLHKESYEIEKSVTHMMMQWGQLINHDITSLVVNKDEEKNISSCRTCAVTQKCMPMFQDPDAPGRCAVNMEHGCVEFSRSTAAFPDVTCASPVREQINLITSFLDGSFLYGNTAEDAEKLRDRSSVLGRGMLILQPGGLLPKSNDENPGDCMDFSHDTKCFRSGDDRVNQNPGIASMHTLFVREHNRIAGLLSVVNPAWSEDTVFQETRKVVVAIFQHITYNEYLPVLLGQDFARRLNLLPGLGSVQTPIYDPNVDPRIFNEYAAAIGRFGHSLVRTLYSRLDKNFTTAGMTSFMLRNNYFRAHLLYDGCQGGLESVMRGFLKDPLMKVDKFFSEDLTKHLFETLDEFGKSFHFDLVAINIMRGRDHGLPSYLKFREFCQLPPVTSWEAMSAFVDSEAVEVYKRLYGSVEDVDVFTAMVAENKDDGELVGPTARCVLGAQFRNLKFGDRFWYETDQMPIGFKPAQLAEIRSYSFAKLLCRNMINTPKIQPQVMLSHKLPNNDFMPCEQLKDINWLLWKS